MMTHSPKDIFFNASAFAETFLRILSKDKRLVPLRYNPTQAHYMANRSSRDLVLKPRQAGFSTVIQGDIFRYATTRTATTLTLSYDDGGTQKLRRMAQRFYNNLPREFRPKRALANAIVTTYPEFDSEVEIATAGSENAGRGSTYTHVHGSEVAFWNDAQNIIGSALQAGSPQWVVFESTPNGAQGWFYDECMNALEGRSIWRLHFYQWWWVDEYRLALDEPDEIKPEPDELELMRRYNLTLEQIKWRRYKIVELRGLEHFLEQYPEDPKTCFKASGVGYFGDVSHAFTAPLLVRYDPSRRYVAGLDFGQNRDYTAMVVIDTKTMQMVDMLRVRQERWKAIEYQIIEMCKKWRISRMYAESNSIGSVMIDNLWNEINRQGLPTSLEPFAMTDASKPPLMASLKLALQERVLALQDVIATNNTGVEYRVLRHELSASKSKQTRNGWTMESPRDENGHGDTVVALALAWLCATELQGSGAWV